MRLNFCIHLPARPRKLNNAVRGQREAFYIQLGDIRQGRFAFFVANEEFAVPDNEAQAMRQGCDSSRAFFECDPPRILDVGPVNVPQIAPQLPNSSPQS